VWGSAVALVSLVIYALTAASSQFAGDTTDFLLSGKTWGVAHAPGYPTLVLLAHLFSWLPVGSDVYRMDMVSAVCSAGTVALVFATGLRLTREAWAAASAAAVLAVAPLFWKWSLVLETFPLNNLLVAATVYLLVRWHQDPERSWFLYGAALTFGLGLTNQQTIALLVPAIGYLLWLHRSALSRRPAIIGWSALAIGLGLLPYLYVPIAARGTTPWNWDYVRSLSAFVNLVTRHDYGGTGFASVSAHATGTYFSTIGYFFVEAGILTVSLWALGAVAGYLRARWYLVFVAIAVVMTLAEFLVVAGLNPQVPTQLFVLERFYLMPMVLLAPLGALALTLAADFLASRATSPRAAVAWVAGFVLALCAVSVAANYSENNLSADKVTDHYARQVLAGLPPKDILFVTQDYADLPVLYAHAAEGVRPDVSVIVSAILYAPWYQEYLRNQGQVSVPDNVTTLSMVEANASRPISFIGNPPDKTLDGQFYLAQDGLAYSLEPEAANISLTSFTAQNQSALALLTFPTQDQIKSVSFEPSILQAYAAVPATVGQNWELRHQYRQALPWYEQAHRIYPADAQITSDLNQLKAKLAGRG
jgi:4-amino-4-deoxy-L-arabinose transferase-like glycosyltransferase